MTNGRSHPTVDSGASVVVPTRTRERSRSGDAAIDVGAHATAVKHAARPLAAERPWLKLNREQHDAQITTAIQQLDHRLTQSPVQAGRFERLECPYTPSMVAYIYHGVGHEDVTVRFPAIADDDEIHDDVRRLVDTINRKIAERRR